MQQWKNQRNYRRKKDENGKVLAFIITIGDQDVEVSEEIYLAYAQDTRREDYINHRETEHTIPMEYLPEQDTNSVDSAEHELLEKLRQQELEHRLRQLPLALESLSEKEQAIISALFFENRSMRQLAREQGVHLRTIEYHRDRGLKKLLKFFS